MTRLDPALRKLMIFIEKADILAILISHMNHRNRDIGLYCSLLLSTLLKESEIAYKLFEDMDGINTITGNFLDEFESLLSDKIDQSRKLATVSQIDSFLSIISYIYCHMDKYNLYKRHKQPISLSKETSNGIVNSVLSALSQILKNEVSDKAFGNIVYTSLLNFIFVVFTVKVSYINDKLLVLGYVISNSLLMIDFLKSRLIDSTILKQSLCLFNEALVNVYSTPIEQLRPDLLEDWFNTLSKYLVDLEADENSFLKVKEWRILEMMKDYLNKCTVKLDQFKSKYEIPVDA